LYSICQTLNEKQVDYIKLANIGIIPPGWLGSAVISWQCSSQSPNSPYWANIGSLGVVVVEKASGYPSGDLTKAYEGFPLFTPPKIAAAVDCPECEQIPKPTPTPTPTFTPTPTATPIKVKKSLDLDGIVLKCAGNTAVANTVVAIRSSLTPYAIQEYVVTNSDGMFTFDGKKLWEGIYFVSVMDGTGWKNLKWYSSADNTWVETFELIDVNKDGDIDTDDLFAKTNLRQLNFVGDYCVTTPCYQSNFNYTVKAGTYGNLNNATITVKGLAGGEWESWTWTFSTNTSGVYPIVMPRGAYEHHVNAMYDGVDIRCPAGTAEKALTVACADATARNVDMLTCTFSW